MAKCCIDKIGLLLLCITRYGSATVVVCANAYPHEAYFGSCQPIRTLWQDEVFTFAGSSQNNDHEMAIATMEQLVQWILFLSTTT